MITLQDTIALCKLETDGGDGNENEMDLTGLASFLQLITFNKLLVNKQISL